MCYVSVENDINMLSISFCSMTSMPASAPLPMSLDEIKKLADAEARDLHPVRELLLICSEC